MARRLRTNVHVGGRWYGPNDEVPEDVAARIGDHAWADDSDQDGEEPAVGFEEPGAGTPPSTAEAPPRSGRGSGVEAWRKFAEQNGIGTDSDMTREEIIAAAEAAGLIEPEQPKE